MVKGKMSKRSTMVDKTLHRRKWKIEQHEYHKNRVISGALEW